MAVSPVTPVPGANAVVTTGGSAVIAVNANPGGGFITNPYSPIDQGLSLSEPLYIDPTGAAATLNGNEHCFRLEPGQTWTIIPGQTTSTSVNAPSDGHKFSVVTWANT